MTPYKNIHTNTTSSICLLHFRVVCINKLGHLTMLNKLGHPFCSESWVPCQKIIMDNGCHVCNIIKNN